MIQKLTIFALLILMIVLTACGGADPQTNSPSDTDNDHSDTVHHDMEDSDAQGIMIVKPVSRLSNPNGAVYMQIMNHTDQDDTLVSAETDIAETVEIHETTIDENEVMRMRPVDGLRLPAGETVTLKQGGLHVMLINLQQDVAEGETFEITLNFEHADSMQITVTVQNGMTGAGDMDHGDHSDN
ncbi:copper chaperone PCu(A)C [Anaerolineales bacterium HSG6]|nr:copper chaperone PCu(A)C [Anaerolineales bacterium HSG6]